MCSASSMWKWMKQCGSTESHKVANELFRTDYIDLFIEIHKKAAERRKFDSEVVKETETETVPVRVFARAWTILRLFFSSAHYLQSNNTSFFQIIRSPALFFYLLFDIYLEILTLFCHHLHLFVIISCCVSPKCVHRICFCDRYEQRKFNKLATSRR